MEYFPYPLRKNNKQINKVKMSNKRNAEEMGADVEDTTEIKKQCIGKENLFFLFFTAALCGGLCQGCDLCHPEVCDPKEANAIRTKAGIIYKQVGHGFDQTFASLTCLFIRMRGDFKRYWTPTARKPDHNGRTNVVISDDDGKPMESQALKFACLAWGKLTPAAFAATAGMPLRDFGRAIPVDHGDENKANNNVSNGMLMTLPEHQDKTKRSAETIATAAMSQSAPCTMTVFDLEGKPLLDSERNPIVKNEPHRRKIMIEYKLKSSQIKDSIKREDTTMNSLVKIEYKGRDCLAQFSWYDLPDLVDDDGRKEDWKPITAADHKMLDVPMSKTKEYFVSDMSRFKSVTRSTRNAKITAYRGQDRPQVGLMGKAPYFSRIVALVFHPEQLKAKIAELKIAKQKDKDGNDYTFATLQVDHIKDKLNHNANNLQFMMGQKNSEKSNGRPCRIWEIGKDDAKTEYLSAAAAAKDIGYKSAKSVRTIIDNDTHKKWRGEYIVE